MDASAYAFYNSKKGMDMDNTIFAVLPFDKSMSNDAVFQVYSCYQNFHPEYFFLLNGCSINEGEMGMFCLPSFRSSNKRQEAKEYLLELTEQWMAEVSSFPTETEKELRFMELIADNIVYGNGEDGTLIGEGQGIGGGLFFGYAVCNGYANALSYFCNAAGIECIHVTSETHAWNRVKLDGIWYETDTTWFDQVNSYDYTWVNKSTRTMLANTDSDAHTIDDTMVKPTPITLPSCTLDMSFAPYRVGAIAGNRSVHISVPDLKNAAYYSVEVKKDGKSLYSVAPFYGYEFDINDLDNGVRYSFVVSACDSSDKVIKNYAEVSAAPYNPPVISGVTAKAGAESAELSWPSVSGAKKYYIYQYRGENT